MCEIQAAPSRSTAHAAAPLFHGCFFGSGGSSILLAVVAIAALLCAPEQQLGSGRANVVVAHGRRVPSERISSLRSTDSRRISRLPRAGSSVAAGVAQPLQWQELVDQGDCQVKEGRYEEARQHYQNAWELLAPAAAVSLATAAVQVRLGETYAREFKPEEALAHYEEAQGIMNGLSSQDPESRAELLMKVGFARSETGNASGALLEYGAALRLLQSLPDGVQTPSGAELLQHMGDMHLQEDCIEAALQKYESARQVHEALGSLSTREAAGLLANMGVLRVQYGEYGQGTEDLVAVRDIFEAEGELQTVDGACLMTNLGHAYAETGAEQEALAQYTSALSIFDEKGALASPEGAQLLQALSSLHIKMESFEQAMPYIETLSEFVLEGIVGPEDVDEYTLAYLDQLSGGGVDA